MNSDLHGQNHNCACKAKFGDVAQADLDKANNILGQKDLVESKINGLFGKIWANEAKISQTKYDISVVERKNAKSKDLWNRSMKKVKETLR